MIVFDEASKHKIDEIKMSLKLRKIKIMMISRGLIRNIQPLDV